MKKRLLSIDAFRGMTIAFMIIVNTPGSWDYVYKPLLHAKWHGCTATDLVFPFFIFAIGLSMAFSFSKIPLYSKGMLLKKILKRSALIFLVGFLLNWFPFYIKNVLDVRIFGVLQRIAMSYFVAGFFVVLMEKEIRLIVVSIVILFSYWLILYLGGDYTLSGNINGKIDLFLFSENNIYGGFGVKFDPEGLLGSISSAGHIIIGYLIGRLLFKTKEAPVKFIRKALLLGVALLASGLIWNLVFPINKPLWTSAYVLYTSGLGCIIFTLMVFILDIQNWRSWSFPLRVFGLNSLFSFVLSIVIVKILLYCIKFEGKNAYGLLYNKVYQPTFGNYGGSFLFALTIMGIVFIFSYILYRKNIWIKL